MLLCFITSERNLQWQDLKVITKQIHVLGYKDTYIWNIKHILTEFGYFRDVITRWLNLYWNFSSFENSKVFVLSVDQGTQLVLNGIYVNPYKLYSNHRVFQMLLCFITSERNLQWQDLRVITWRIDLLDHWNILCSKLCGESLKSECLCSLILSAG